MQTVLSSAVTMVRVYNRSATLIHILFFTQNMYLRHIFQRVRVKLSNMVMVWVRVKCWDESPFKIAF